MCQSNMSFSIALLSSVMLSACGGGSGGGSTATPSNPTSTIPAATDTVPPTLATTAIVSPANGDGNVSKNAPISFRASEPLSSAKVILTCGGTVVPTVNTFLLDTVTSTPSQSLPYGTACTATVDSTSTKDLAGNKFGSNVLITSFTVEKAPVVVTPGDTTAPTISAVISPLNGSTGVSLMPNISFKASEPLSSVRVILTCGGTAIPTNNTINSDVVVAAPIQNLAYGASCVATVDSSMTKDMTGNKFVSNVVITSFTVEQAPVVVIPPTSDKTPPNLTGIVFPSNGSINVATDAKVIFQVSEPLSSIKTLMFCGANSAAVAVSSWTSGNSVTVTPVAPYPTNATCNLLIDRTGSKDLAGNAFSENWLITKFTTDGTVVVIPPDTGPTTPTGDVTPPVYLGGIFPADGATDVMPNTEIQFDMSEKVATIRVSYSCTGGTSANYLDNADVYDKTTSRVKFMVASALLPYGSTCVVTLHNADTRDLANNLMKGYSTILTTFKVRSRVSSVVCDQTAPRTSVPVMSGKPLVEVCNGIFSDPAISTAEYGEVAQVRTFSMNSIKKFFGTSKMTTVPDIIACKTAECSVFFMDADYGGRVMPQGMSTQNGSFTAPRDTFVVGKPYGSEFNRLLVSAHELTHVEFLARLGNGRVPTWFNEGLATYVGGSPVCRPFTPGVTLPAKAQPDLKDQTQWKIDAPHYCQGSDEITSWVQKNGKQALIDLLDKVKNGAEFYSVYGNLIN